MVLEIREEITGVFQEIDVNGDGTVSKDEFDQMKESEIVRAALNKVTDRVLDEVGQFQQIPGLNWPLIVVMICYG